MINISKEIIEGNRLIAEFMGFEIERAETGTGENRTEYFRYHPAKGGYYKELMMLKHNGFPFLHFDKRATYQICFHSSFNWLMPVVEHIEKGNYGFKMCRKVVEVYYDDSKELILKEKRSCRVESLWYAIVSFVKWHNEKIKKS